MNTITSRSYGETIKKYPKDMTTEELRAKADAEGLAFYKSQYEQDPTNPQAKYEYERYAAQVGVSIEPEVNRLQSLSRAQLAEEWTREGQKIEAAETDSWRAANARTWLASQPAYQATPENGAKITAELESLGLRGSVGDLQICFDRLVKHGDITPLPQPIAPVKLYTEAELRAMPLDQMRAYIENAGREGIL